ncbi:MAG: hypothetical protein GX660_21310 [Clostridiaceae bacterium]|nr:hypothetical protein [Clostridiaceae bacterium]
MKKIIAVEINILSDLSKEYSKYGESVYSTYKTGMSKIEGELESIRRNYKDYRNVTKNINNLKKELKEIESIIKNVNSRADELSKDLYKAACSYDECNKKEKNMIKNMKSKFIDIDKLPICIKSGDTGSTPDNFFDKVIDNLNLAAGIKKRMDTTMSDLNYDLSEIMKQFVSNPQDCLELIKSVLVKINSKVQDEWDYYHNIYSSSIRNLQQSFSDFGFNVNLEALTDIQLDDVIGHIMEQRAEQEDDGFSWFDPGRVGRMWDAFTNEKFPPLTIINPTLMADFSLEFFFTDTGITDKDTYREWRHHVLSAAGFIPKIGPIFGFMDAMIYAGREGDLMQAYLSAGLALPSFGKFAGLWDLAEGADNILTFVDGLNFGTGLWESVIGMDNEESIIDVADTIIDKADINPGIINGINNSISDITTDILSEASQIAPSDFFKLPQLVNVTVNDAIRTEWKGFMSNAKNIQNSVTDFVF